MTHAIHAWVGARMRSRREALHLESAELGARLGVSGAFVLACESGAQPMDARFLFDVCQAMDAPVGYFLGRDEAAKPRGEGKLSPEAEPTGLGQPLLRGHPRNAPEGRQRC